MFNSIGVDHRLLALAVICAVAMPAMASAQLRAELVAKDLPRPVAIVPDPTDPNTLFIVNQTGTIDGGGGRRHPGHAVPRPHRRSEVRDEQGCWGWRLPRTPSGCSSIG